VKLSDKALATSGSHQRFVEIDGIRYSHIIDPRTGRPVIGLLGASVVAENPAESDALSTAFFILGIEKSEAYCKTHPGVGVILISSTPDGEPEVVRAGVV
jgi:thiamine biosynthesis lipoprotein